MSSDKKIANQQKLRIVINNINNLVNDLDEKIDEGVPKSKLFTADEILEIIFKKEEELSDILDMRVEHTIDGEKSTTTGRVALNKLKDKVSQFGNDSKFQDRAFAETINNLYKHTISDGSNSNSMAGAASFKPIVTALERNVEKKDLDKLIKIKIDGNTKEKTAGEWLADMMSNLTKGEDKVQENKADETVDCNDTDTNKNFLSFSRFG